MIENIRLSFRGIFAHKMRSFLTMLGIIIGIASIIAIVSTIKGTNDQIEKNLIGSGNNTVKVALYQEDWEYSFDSGIPNGVPTVSKETLESLKNIDHVEGATLYRSRQSYQAIFRNNTSLDGGYIMGVQQDYFSIAGLTILFQFLTEAIVLTSIGGIAGVITGIGLAKLISILNGTPVSISIPAMILSVLFSMAIGIIFGLLPSYKAANLDPIEALRHE